jgi:hypothetical protein
MPSREPKPPLPSTPPTIIHTSHLEQRHAYPTQTTHTSPHHPHLTGTQKTRHPRRNQHLIQHSHPTINNMTELDSTTLKIWQQNLNTSHSAQLSLLNRHDCASWDILALQEPYTNPLNNTTVNRHYHVVYPTTRYTDSSKCVRAVTLISNLLNANTWTQTPFPSPDVVIIQLRGPYSQCTLINIYNNGNSDHTINLLTTFLEDNIQTIKPSENDHMLWIGDFNRHHPLWEEE